MTMTSTPTRRRISEDQLDRDLEAMVHTIGSLIDRLPGALRAIVAASTVTSGYGERSGDPSGGPGLPGSSVEAVVMRAAEAERDAHRIGLHVSFLARELHELNSIAGRWNPVRNDVAECAGGDPSTWGSPTCGDLVEYSIRPDGTRYERSLCPKHRKRRDRWMRANGLEVTSD